MWPDDSGSWDLGDSFATPVTSSTVPIDLSQVTQAQDNSGVGSSWTGFLQQGLDQVLAYGISKDKAASQAALSTQQAQALATTGAAVSNVTAANNRSTILIVGGLVLVGLVLMHGKV